VAPILAMAIPIGKLVDRISRKRAFEHPESYARTRSHAPGETVGAVNVIKSAAIPRYLHGGNCHCFGGVCTENLNADVVMMKSAEYRV
jgi:hypothetical protein